MKFLRERERKKEREKREKNAQKERQTTAFCVLCVRARVLDKENIVSNSTISI